MPTIVIKKVPKTKKGLKSIVWGIPNKTKANCYTFALAPKMGKGGYYKNRMYKARVGDKCPEFKNVPFEFKNCSQIIKRILCDNPRFVQKVSPHSKWLNANLGPDHHLMCAWLSPGKHTDFHFARRLPIQEVFNEWSEFSKRTPKKALIELVTKKPKYVWVHQRGWSNTGPIIYDAKGNLMLDPKKANMNYGSLDYSLFCGLYKVRTRMATVTTEYDY